MQLVIFLFISLALAISSQPSEITEPEIDSSRSSESRNTGGDQAEPHIVKIDDLSQADAEDVISTYEKALETTGMSKEQAWETIHKFEKMISEGDAEQAINDFAHIISQPGARKILSRYEEMMSKDDARRIINNWESMMNESDARDTIGSLESLLKKEGAQAVVDEYEGSLKKAGNPKQENGSKDSDPINAEGKQKIIDDYKKLIDGDRSKAVAKYNEIMSEPGARQIISDYESMVSNEAARHVISSYEKLMGEEVSRQIISNYAQIMSKEEGRQIISNYPILGEDDEKSASDTKTENTFSRGFLKPTPEPPKAEVEKKSVGRKQKLNNSARVSASRSVDSASETISEHDARKIISNYDKTLSHRDDSRLIISSYVRSLGHDSAEL
jgi:hypothetical protein